MAIASVIAAEKAKNANGVSAPQPSLPSQTLTKRLWLVGAADHHGHAAVSFLHPLFRLSSQLASDSDSLRSARRMFMNAGQALGPMIGAFLFGINLYVPW